MATPQHTPTGRGFDSSLVYFHHANDFWTRETGGCAGGSSIDPLRPHQKEHFSCVDLWDTDGPAVSANASAGAAGMYEEELFKKRALAEIASHPATTPFFLYYASHLAHLPYEVPEAWNQTYSFIDNPNRRTYHAMVGYLDGVVGELVAAFQKKGLWENTLMVFT